jgi:glycosyltransferase involved in cell wall biosynthesis
VHALRSVEAQSYRRIEVVVVNARATPHPALPPDLGLPVRLVQLQRDLTRPQAANAGLDNSRGEYIIFLDDDDTFEPEHIASLVACLRANPDHLVAYGGTRILGEQGEHKGELKVPFNRLTLLKDNYIQIGAAMFSAQLLMLGCRFDEEMIMFQDWDFWIQACRWTAFAYTGMLTANWRAYSGGSGAGLGGNFNGERNAAYAKKVRQKWAGWRVSLMTQYRYAVDRGRALLAAGRTSDAGRWIASAQSIVSGKV